MLASVRPRSTTVTYTPLLLTCATGLVSAADSNGNTTSALILVAVVRSCSWLACSAALAAVLIVIFRSLWVFSSSFFASLAHQTMPAVKLCVAAGIATPRLTLFCAIAAGRGQRQHRGEATRSRRVANVMVMVSRVVAA